MLELSLGWLVILVDTSLKSVLLAGIVTAALKLLVIVDANIRHRAWLGVLAGMLLLPLISPLVPNVRLPIVPPRAGLLAWTPAVASPQAELAPAADNHPFERSDDRAAPLADRPPYGPPASKLPSGFEFGGRLQQPEPPPSPQASGGNSPQMATASAPSRTSGGLRRAVIAGVVTLAGTWLTVALALAARIFAGMVIAIRLRQQSAPLTPGELTNHAGGLACGAEVRQSERIRVPLTVGLWRPSILLPADWRDWPLEKLRAVLAHEQMHTKRGDCLVALAAEINCCQFWFHPLAWWLKAQLAALAEQACDDAAIDSTGSRTQYARHLLEVAGAVSRQRGRLVPTGVSMARRSNVETRIHAILDFTRPLSRQLSWRATLALVAVMTPLIVLAAALKPLAGQQQEKSATSKLTQSASQAPPGNEERRTDPPGDPGRTESNERPLDDATYTFAGTVVDHRGQPVAGARITFDLWQRTDEVAHTDEQGRFRFTRDNRDLVIGGQPRRPQFAAICAFKEGHGFATGLAAGFETSGRLLAELTDRQREMLSRKPNATENVLRLVPDDAPIRGRILNSEGQPVRGAKIEVVAVWEGLDGNLDAWTAAAAEPGTDYYMARAKLTQLANGRGWKDQRAVAVEPVKTGDDGWFTLQGLGRDRIAEMFVSGPGIETVMLHVRARAGEPITLPRENRSPHLGTATYYPSEFTHIVGRSQPVEGRITDSKTGEPLPDFVVQASKIATHPITGSFEATYIRTKTDADGRYRLEGLPLGDNSIVVLPPDGSRYLPAGFSCKTSADQQPLVQDAALLPGVLLRGQVTDRKSGQPLSGTIQYLAFDTNPHLKDARGFSRSFGSDRHRADDDGRYELAVLPGPGLLTFMADKHQDYPRGIGADEVEGPRTGVDNAFFLTVPFRVLPQNAHLLKGLNPSPDDQELTVDLTLTAGAAFLVRVRRADGQPLGEYYVKGKLGFGGWDHYPQTGDTFQVQGYFASDGRTLMVYHPEGNLVGLTEVTGDDPTDIEVVLRDGGTLKGRVIDADGTPLEGLQVYGEMPSNFRGRPVMTDADGRFELKGLVPGVKYSATAIAPRKQFGQMQMTNLGRVFTETTVESGQAKDLGDVQIKSEQPASKETDSKSRPPKAAGKNPAESEP